MAVEDVLAVCIEKWRREGIPLLPAVEEAEVRRTWEGFGKQAAEDVVRFYSTVGGFVEYEFDDRFFWSLWPWDLLRQENTDRQGDGVMFCDHSLQVITWELRFEDDVRSSVWTARELYADPEMTAPSLESFLRIYFEDPWQLLNAWKPQDRDPTKQQGLKRGGAVADKSDPLWDKELDR